MRDNAGVMADDAAFGTPILAALERWRESGAVWRVLTWSPGEVTVSLCRCDDGEEVDRLRSTDPVAVRALADRRSSDD